MHNEPIMTNVDGTFATLQIEKLHLTQLSIKQLINVTFICRIPQISAILKWLFQEILYFVGKIGSKRILSEQSIYYLLKIGLLFLWYFNITTPYF